MGYEASRQADLLLAIGLIGLIGMMLVPLPPPLLDILLTLNLSLSLVVLLVAMYVRRPLDFSILPSLLLITTLFRLALNISSTRLILLHAAAGRVIEAFGNFVVGGDLLVGSVVFIILVVIQFVVITNGAQRVAEVAARFTLDEMPGKQMSIDADLNAGLITEEEARARRREIEREADYYGAMDGASKFIRGDAIAALIIVGVNILGGIAIGVGRLRMPLMDALQRYALLTVGDGLVSQIPALLVSTATGIVVTRSASDHDLGRDLLGQLASQPRAIQIAGALLFTWGLVPGLPKFSFLVLGGGLFLLAWQMSRVRIRKQETAAAETPPRAPAPAIETTPPSVDRLALRLGYGLIGLLEDREAPGIPTRIAALRQQLSRDLGIIIPPVRICDDFTLGANQYAIDLRGHLRARGELRPDRLLAVPAQPEAPPLPGEETREPIFQMRAYWIPPEVRLQAETRGYTVVEPAAVVATHLSETIRRYAADILSRQDVADLIERIRASEPAVVNELIPELASIGQVHQALRQLLDEGVSIRDLASILEALTDGLRLTRNLLQAVEYVRMTQAEAICERLQDEEGVVHAAALAPALESVMEECLMQTPEGAVCALPPEVAQSLLTELSAFAEEAARRGWEPVVLAPPRLRPHLRNAIARSLPQVHVLSYAEIAPPVRVEAVRQIGQKIPERQVA